MRAIFRILQLASIFLLAAVAFGACNTFLLRRFVDFPCFVEYDAARQCLDVSNYYGPAPAESPALEVYLSRFEARSSGGWCSYESAGQGESLAMSGPLGSLAFSAAGDQVILNAIPLPPGEPYDRSSFFILNPWAGGSERLTSYGMIAPCEGGAPRLVVIGSAGTRPLVWKGALISIVLLALSILFGRLARRRKEKPAGV